MSGRAPLLVDQYGQPLKRASVSYGLPAYRASDRFSEDLHAWTPRLQHPEDELEFERGPITARARDLARNNPTAAGIVRREVDTVIGSQFRLASKPDWKALGLGEAWGEDFGAAAESLWRNWAEDPLNRADDTRVQHVTELFGLAWRNLVVDGDALALLNWRPDRPNATTLRVIDPDLLQNPRGQMLNTREWRRGVRVDSTGAAIAYNFASRHPSERGAVTTEDRTFPREMDWGRPVVVHYFDRQRDGQVRGVSKLAPLVAGLKMQDAYTNAELSAAILNAVLAAFIQSPFDHEQLDDVTKLTAYQADRKAFHASNSITAAGAKLMALYPGETIGTIASERPNTNYEGFARALDRRLAAGSGHLYEQLSADYSQSTYSSVRAAGIDYWRHVNVMRRGFGQRFARPVYGALLEEAVSKGAMPMPRRAAPDFHANLTAYTSSRWLSDGKGFVDPVKEVKAAVARVASGLSTMEIEANELTGSDYQENLAQLSREMAAMPEGTLHPASVDFVKLVGGPQAPSEAA